MRACPRSAASPSIGRATAPCARGSAQYAKCQYDFDPSKVQRMEGYKMLRLAKNDVVTVVRTTDRGWTEGKASDGTVGWFPSNYVKFISAEEAGAPATSASALGSLNGVGLRRSGTNLMTKAGREAITARRGQDNWRRRSLAHDHVAAFKHDGGG